MDMNIRMTADSGNSTEAIYSHDSDMPIRLVLARLRPTLTFHCELTGHTARDVEQVSQRSLIEAVEKAIRQCIEQHRKE